MDETDLPRILEITARLEFRRTEREYRLTGSRQAGSGRLVWVTGDRSCPFCRYMEGKAVRSDDPRIDLLIPAHIGCECLWAEVGDREVGKLDWLDFEDEEFVELRDTHAHFAKEPGKYEALRVPASPSGRDFVFRRGKAGEPGTREWKRPRYEERDDLIETGVEERGERWRALSERSGAAELRESDGGVGGAEPLPAGEPAAPEPLPPRAQQVLQGLNSYLFGVEDHEEGYAIRLDGTLVGPRVMGSRFGVAVPLPDEGRERMIVTHNHWSGSSFSPEDFEDACRSGMHELQVATPTQVLYRLQRPEAGWPDLDEVRDVLSSYGATQQAVKEAHPELDRRGVSHEVARRVAARLGLRYSREVRAVR